MCVRSVRPLGFVRMPLSAFRFWGQRQGGFWGIGSFPDRGPFSTVARFGEGGNIHIRSPPKRRLTTFSTAVSSELEVPSASRGNRKLRLTAVSHSESLPETNMYERAMKMRMKRV